MSDFLPSHAEGHSWEQLGTGGPTLLALARLASATWTQGRSLESIDDLSDQARSLLFMAGVGTDPAANGGCGVFEVRGTNKAFETGDRLITVYVQINDDQWLRFCRTNDIRGTLRFLEGFRELCAAGLVIHHLYHEFSLSEAGFQWARQVAPAPLSDYLAFGEPCGWERL